MKKLVIVLLSLSLLFGQDKKDEDLKVKITEDMPYIITSNSGKDIRVQRIQDVDNSLTDDYTKTSRPCPPFCIQPTKLAEGIKNIEEIELLKFMQNEVLNGTGVVIDTRLKSWFELETIPSAINIPFPVIEDADDEKAKRIFKLLGAEEIKGKSELDFTNAKKVALFCNGPWCGQTKHFVDGMIKHGYPRDKMLYYRSGFQGWKLLGLTTIIHKEIKK